MSIINQNQAYSQHHVCRDGQEVRTAILVCPAEAGSETEVRGIAFDIRRRIIGLKKEITTRFMELGALLDVVHRYRLWEGFATSFSAFCADPEIALKPSTAYRLMRVYRMASDLGLINHPLVLRAGVERAAAVLPAARNREDAIEKLEEAVALPVKEVELIYRGHDPQTKAIDSLLTRFCVLNSPSRLIFLVRAYMALTPEERMDFWKEIERATRIRLSLDGAGDE